MSEEPSTIRVFMTPDTTKPSPYGKERPALNDVQRIIIHTPDGRLVISTDKEGHATVWVEKEQDIVYSTKGDEKNEQRNERNGGQLTQVIGH